MLNTKRRKLQTQLRLYRIVDKQRSQTAHWFEKYKEKEAISNEMLTLLENKSIEIEELNRIIRALKNKTDTETKVIKLE